MIDVTANCSCQNERIICYVGTAYVPTMSCRSHAASWWHTRPTGQHGVTLLLSPTRSISAEATASSVQDMSSTASNVITWYITSHQQPDLCKPPRLIQADLLSTRQGRHLLLALVRDPVNITAVCVLPAISPPSDLELAAAREITLKRCQAKLSPRNLDRLLREAQSDLFTL